MHPRIRHQRDLAAAAGLSLAVGCLAAALSGASWMLPAAAVIAAFGPSLAVIAAVRTIPGVMAPLAALVIGLFLRVIACVVAVLLLRAVPGGQPTFLIAAFLLPVCALALVLEARLLIGSLHVSAKAH